jgi:hypothetical protein
MNGPFVAAVVVTLLFDLAWGAARAQTSAPATPAAGQAVTGVIERIKQDVAYYYSQKNTRKLDVAAVASKAVGDTPDPAKCPIEASHYDFQITKIEVRLQVAENRSRGAEAGLEVPWIGLKVGSQAKVAAAVTSTHTLTVDLFPNPDEARTFELPPTLRDAAPTAQVARQRKVQPAAAAAATAEPPSRITPISDTLNLAA